MKIKAAVTYKKGNLTFDDNIELNDNLKSNQVLVKLVATGVCHTDSCALNQELPYPIPGVLGHEGSGIVEKIGPNVERVKVGDHVVLSFSSCCTCDNCKSGKPNLCDDMQKLNFGGRLKDGSTPLSKDGQEISNFFGQSSFATYSVVDENNVVKVDKDVDLSLLGPLGCGFSTGAGTVLNKLKPEVGSTIAVYGTGAVGLSALMAARIAGCTKIIAVDIVQSRLDLALELGATHAINSTKVDVVEEIKKITNGKGSTYAVETTGVPVVFMNALHALSINGTVAQIGVAKAPVTIDLDVDIMQPSKTIVGVIEGEAVPAIFIPQLIEYYKSGRFPFDKLIKFYDFEEIEQAFKDSASGKTIKPILKIAK